MSFEALPKLLIVGLGNPGRKYALTRHNLGFMVVETFASSLGWSFEEDKRFCAKLCKGNFEGRSVDLMMPETFMNLSGSAVRRYLDYYKMGIDQVVVVSDDVALPFGELRIRKSGSSGGHNGLKSLIACLGSQDFIRLRMGIGRIEIGNPQAERQDLAEYVLSEFCENEQRALNEFIIRGVQVLKNLFTTQSHE